VSYQLDSRSGHRAQFEDMVRRCNDAGVQVYVDAVINHMTGSRFPEDPNFGVGSGGSTYEYYNYPPLYGAQDFHACRSDISDYGNGWQVQNCNLVALADLDTGAEEVQAKVAACFNDLVDPGVAGFRIGAGSVVTHKDGRLYDLANVFVLARPYGYPRIMSSYSFETGDQGPPGSNGNTDVIYQNDTPNCFGEWKCEHRWRPIANMVAFRNHTLSAWFVRGGRESAQTSVSNGRLADGSALDWTTNHWPTEWGEKRTVAVNGFGEEPLNQYGAHYWMLDVDLDCSRTADGWFELKSYIANGAGREADVQQAGTPYTSRNHFAGADM